jgi:hypothetical protein
VAGQRRVARLELAFPPEVDQRGDGPGVVPPNLLGDRTEELEGRDHPLEDRLGTFEGQRQDEGGVGVRPGRDQKRHEPAALGKINVDVPEIGFETLTWRVGQWDERFLMPASMLPEIALDLSVPAAVGVLVAEPPEELGGGVPLLGGCGLVVAKDLVDDLLDRPQQRSESVPGRRQGIGLGLLEDLPDGVARMPEFARDLADGLTIAPRPPNGSVVVHRKHVLDPP